MPDHQELPPLPEPNTCCGEYAGPPGEGASCDLWDADQMRAYALQAFEAGKRSAPRDIRAAIDAAMNTEAKNG